MNAQAHEEWRVIEEFPDYAVSNLGRVKRIAPDSFGKMSGAPLSPGIGSTGYPHVVLRKGGRRHNRAVHRLVCVTFRGLPPTSGHEVAHGDGVRTNCRLDNLRWASRSENHADKHMHGTAQTGETHWSTSKPECCARGDSHGMAKLSAEDVRAIRADTRRQKEIAAAFGVSQGAVSAIKVGRTWSHVQ